MDFTHDTEAMLQATAGLVNTAPEARGPGSDSMSTLADLDDFLTRWPMSGTRAHSADEVQQVRAMRAVVAEAWTVTDRDELVELVNALFERTDARPYLARHDEWDWHLHVARSRQSVAERLGAEAAMGLADLIRADSVDRLRHCQADQCEGVLVDLSKNRSRRFCSITCANRTHAAASRARRSAAAR